MRRVKLTASPERGWQVVDEEGHVLPVAQGAVSLNPDGMSFNFAIVHTLVELEGHAKLAVADPGTGVMKDVKRIEFSDGTSWSDVNMQ